MIKIIDVLVSDIRFPTSSQSDGSDAMNPDPDYSATYVTCGEIIDGTMDVQEMGSIIFQKILATASGELTKSEEFGFGDYEFAPWKVGAVL